MKLSDTCIKRPVLSIVLSLIIILIGIASFYYLNIRFFPKFEPKRVYVSTSFSGASAKLVESSITDPIETELSTVPDIKYMTSESSRGESSIKITLKANADIDEITNEIRNKLSIAQSQLPDGVKPPTIQVGWSQNNFMNLTFTDPSKSPAAIRDYIKRYVNNTLLQSNGIGNILIHGADTYAMRISLNPEKMAARNISVNDVQTALINSNIEMPAGVIKSQSLDFPVTANTRLKSISDFKNLAIRNTSGQLVGLKDIATVKLGNASDNKSLLLINGHPGVLVQLFTQADASPIAAAIAMNTTVKTIRRNLPPGMKMAIFFNAAQYLKAAVHEVYFTIAFATICVLVAIFLFLGSLRSVFIPVITIPICVIAAFGVIYLCGFTINIITLLAIVLAIGLVVDDAIVMLENIHRFIEQGYTPLESAFKGSQQIAFAVIGMTICLAAVYAPVGFMHGHIAVIFRQFAFTLAGTVLISGFIALTLTPMMCSRLLEKKEKESAYMQMLERFFDKLRLAYQNLLEEVLKLRFLIVIIAIMIAAGGTWLFKSLPSQFMPHEDIGMVLVSLNPPTGASFSFIKKDALIAERIIQKTPGVKSTAMGISDGADAFNAIWATLKPYDSRKASASQIAAALTLKFNQIPGLNTFAFAPSPLSGSAHQDLRFTIMTSGNYKDLFKSASSVIKTISQYPGLTNVNNQMSFDSQQYEITLNRAMAASLGVTASSIDNTIAVLLGGQMSTRFNVGDYSYDVILQAAPEFLQNISDIGNFYVRSNTGQLVPLTNLIKVKSTLGEATLPHYNHLRSTDISAQLANGYSIGKAMQYLNQTLPTLLPANTKFSYRGMAANIQENNHSMAVIFVMAIVFIYLVLAAFFESFIDPFIVLLVVPLSIVSALFTLRIVGGSLNVYTDIGLVTLVGLIAKHGILITQFINELRDSGEELTVAICKGASVRLRPVLMTTTAMIFGVLPLLFAPGASSESRFQLGIVLVSGLFFGTFFSLFVVPVAYSYLARFKRQKKQTVDV